MSSKMTRRLICLQDDTLAALDGLSKERNRNRSQLIEMILRQHPWMIRMGTRLQIVPWKDRATQGGKQKAKRKPKSAKESPET
jgi:hypothetical protein